MHGVLTSLSSPGRVKKPPVDLGTWMRLPLPPPIFFLGPVALICHGLLGRCQ